MRIVKLSPVEFATVADVDNFFNGGIQARTPQGLFRFRDQIRDGGLQQGEMLLFTYDATLRYIARVMSGRQPNTFLPHADFPNCFVIDVATIQPTLHATAAEVEHALSPFQPDLNLHSQGWNEVPDSPAAETAALGFVAE